MLDICESTLPAKCSRCSAVQLRAWSLSPVLPGVLNRGSMQDSASGRMGRSGCGGMGLAVELIGKEEGRSRSSGARPVVSGQTLRSTETKTPSGVGCGTQLSRAPRLDVAGHRWGGLQNEPPSDVGGRSVP